MVQMPSAKLHLTFLQLLLQMPVTDENMAEVERLTRSVHKIWEGLMGEDAGWQPGAEDASHRECEQAALEQTDRQLLGWAARDPDAKVGLMHMRRMRAVGCSWAGG
jgi:hypothetical protein